MACQSWHESLCARGKCNCLTGIDPQPAGRLSTLIVMMRIWKKRRWLNTWLSSPSHAELRSDAASIERTASAVHCIFLKTALGIVRKLPLRRQLRCRLMKTLRSTALLDPTASLEKSKLQWQEKACRNVPQRASKQVGSARCLLCWRDLLWPTKMWAR